MNDLIDRRILGAPGRCWWGRHQGVVVGLSHSPHEILPYMQNSDPLFVQSFDVGDTVGW